VKITATITFCQLLLMNAREVIVKQLELSGLVIREESGIVPVDMTVRADLVDLMARILVAVFEAKGERVDDRASLQSQDQVGASGAQGDRLLTAVERQTGALQPGESTPAVRASRSYTKPGMEAGGDHRE
jgi:hypothetical protein